MSIEDRHTELAEMVEAALDPTRQAYSAEEIMESVRAAMRAVLEEMTQPSLGLCCPGDAEYVAGIRAQINALGAPQPHGEHAEPPQEEGTHEV
jgi:predicted component of type VI protein secretion system